MNYNPSTVTKIMDAIIPFVRALSGIILLALFATAASGGWAFGLFAVCLFIILLVADPIQ